MTLFRVQRGKTDRTVLYIDAGTPEEAVALAVRDHGRDGDVMTATTSGMRVRAYRTRRTSAYRGGEKKIDVTVVQQGAGQSKTFEYGVE